MVYRFGRDLRIARRRAALTQTDCAHLLGVDQPRISKLEAGKSMPSMIELGIFHFVFDQAFGSVSRDIVAALARVLQERLANMPGCPENWPDRRRRTQTLDRLAEKLEALGRGDHE